MGNYWLGKRANGGWVLFWANLRVVRTGLNWDVRDARANHLAFFFSSFFIFFIVRSCLSFFFFFFFFVFGFCFFVFPPLARRWEQQHSSGRRRSHYQSSYQTALKGWRTAQRLTFRACSGFCLLVVLSLLWGWAAALASSRSSHITLTRTVSIHLINVVAVIVVEVVIGLCRSRLLLWCGVAFSPAFSLSPYYPVPLPCLFGFLIPHHYHHYHHYYHPSYPVHNQCSILFHPILFYSVLFGPVICPTPWLLMLELTLVTWRLSCRLWINLGFWGVVGWLVGWL
ncbi:hypothetical protein BKA80DRAFT_280703, partial [Phyllosticta citrichinensis]